MGCLQASSSRCVVREAATASIGDPILNPSGSVSASRTGADEPDHMFQTLTADIEANPKIREPQQGAHRAIRTHFEASNEPVILQIPVGCGKTGVIATLPFGVAKGRALVITPNLTIRSGVAESLDISNPKNFWRRTGGLHDFA